MNDERLDDLIDAHFSSAMNDDERVELEDRLLHSASDRARFWELSEIHLLTHEIAQQSLAGANVMENSGMGNQPVGTTSQAERVRHKIPSRVLSRFLFSTAAATLLAIGSITWFALSSAPETGLIVTSADAMVHVERDGKGVMLPVGAMLLEKDAVVTQGASVVLSYLAEETRLELASETKLEVLSHRDGKQLRLRAGSLTAEVSPQPEASPMRVFSQGAEAVVLGTRFTLNADPTNHGLEVQKGAVRVNRVASADSIVVSSEERVKLNAKVLELEVLQPTALPTWRDEQTLVFDFESELSWSVLRNGRRVSDPNREGNCLAGELIELVRRKRDLLVLATGLRPQCVISDDSLLKLRYWSAPGIGNIEIFLYVVGIERAFKVKIEPDEHNRWVHWTIPFTEMMSSSGTPPSGAIIRLISIHTGPISGPLPFYIDDVELEYVMPCVNTH